MMMHVRGFSSSLSVFALLAACRTEPTVPSGGPFGLLEKSSSITKSVLHVGDTATIRFALRNRTQDVVRFPIGGCGPAWILSSAGQRVYPGTLPICIASAQYYSLAPGAEFAQTLEIQGGQVTPQLLPGVPLNVGRYEAFSSLFPSIHVHFEVVQ